MQRAVAKGHSARQADPRAREKRGKSQLRPFRGGGRKKKTQQKGRKRERIRPTNGGKRKETDSRRRWVAAWRPDQIFCLKKESRKQVSIYERSGYKSIKI